MTPNIPARSLFVPLVLVLVHLSDSFIDIPCIELVILILVRVIVAAWPSTRTPQLVLQKIERKKKNHVTHDFELLTLLLFLLFFFFKNKKKKKKKRRKTGKEEKKLTTADATITITGIIPIIHPTVSAHFG